MEESIEVKVFEIKYKCDECNDGYLILNNDCTLLTHPAQYPHKCDKCGSTKHFTIVYPYYKYEKI